MPKIIINGVTVDSETGIPTQGTTGSDLIVGSITTDWITAGFGNDTVYAGGGNDYVDGGYGNDMLYGEAGNDTLFGSDGNDTLDGGTGLDRLMGGDGNDVYITGSDFDTIVETATGGIDEVRLADNATDAGYSWGYWSLRGSFVENMTYVGGGTFVGYGSDADNVIRSNANQSSWVDAGAGNDTIIGTGLGAFELHAGAGNDVALLGGGKDLAFGDGGNDNLDGGLGDDSLSGGDGADTLIGGGGDDLLSGNTAGTLNDGKVDWLYGGAGFDTLLGGDGDMLLGGVGNDTYVIDGQSSAGIIEQRGEGRDTVVVVNGTSYTLGANLEDLDFSNDWTGALGIGNGLNNFLRGTAYGDTLQGGNGNDTLRGLDGADLLDGGDGDDQLDGDGWQTGGNDTLDGGLGNDVLDGGQGNDLLKGGAGNDQLFGDVGDDVLSGGAGDDLLIGGQGIDQIWGGAGADTFCFRQNGDSSDYAGFRDQVMDFQVGLDKITFDQGNGGFDGFVANPFHLALSSGPAANSIWQEIVGGKLVIYADMYKSQFEWGDQSLADTAIEVTFADGVRPSYLSASDFLL